MLVAATALTSAFLMRVEQQAMVKAVVPASSFGQRGFSLHTKILLGGVVAMQYPYNSSRRACSPVLTIIAGQRAASLLTELGNEKIKRYWARKVLSYKLSLPRYPGVTGQRGLSASEALPTRVETWG